MRRRELEKSILPPDGQVVPARSEAEKLELLKLQQGETVFFFFIVVLLYNMKKYFSSPSQVGSETYNEDTCGHDGYTGERSEAKDGCNFFKFQHDKSI
jgi:hypothetical protein